VITGSDDRPVPVSYPRRQVAMPMKSWITGVAAIVAAPVPAATGGEILWDSFGVPHVYARTEAGMFYGFGYAQAQAHGNLLLHIYGESRARAAEYWGAKFEASDRWLIANGQPERSVAWYKAQTPAFRADLDAFAAGINAYVTAHPEKLDSDVLKLGKITGLDVMAHAHRVMTYLYIASQQRVIGVAGNVGEGDYDPAAAPGDEDGSNAWAVAPSRSASGHAMLLANPHLQWAPSWQTYFEANLTAPGVALYGATQVGLPVLRFAFSKDVAFTNTVNTILGFTRYRLTLRSDGYVFDGKTFPFHIAHKSYKVLQPDGSLKIVEFDQRSAVQGPVFDMPDGSTIALKVAGLDRPGGLAQYYDMGRARGWAEMEKALRRLQVPMFNIVYADKDGHILYLDNGILPKHPQGGDFATWSRPAAGDTSATVWTDVHRYDDLPKVFDPASGFVQNSNDPPWVTSWPQPLLPRDYPAYVAAIGPMSQRSQMSVKLLSEGPKLDFATFVEKKVTTRSLMADRLLPELVPLAAASEDSELRSAAALLKSWDHRYEPGAKGALLFETWAAIFSPSNFTDAANYREPWSSAAPISTPRGLKDPARAVAMLKQAIGRTKELYGAVDRPYGEVSRFHLGDVDLPGNGGFGNTGVFRTITWGPMKDGQRTPVHGETWVSMVEFGTPMKAVGLMSYGNSSQPGSRHRGDQLPFLAAKTFRTLWTDRAEVEKHLEETTKF
jgi:acyl-homoserine-lactone acylase